MLMQKPHQPIPLGIVDVVFLIGAFSNTQVRLLWTYLAILVSMRVNGHNPSLSVELLSAQSQCEPIQPAPNEITA